MEQSRVYWALSVNKRLTPIVLVILDGWGVSPKRNGNAIALAHTPVMRRLTAKYPHTLLKASGEAVGLPPRLMGNSEVGHLNIGAGRVVVQPILRISAAIRDGSFFRNPVLLEALQNVKERGSSLHLIGLLSDGRVHSSMDHVFALLELARRNRVGRVYLHVYLDGRDTPPRSAHKYVQQLERRIAELDVGAIATVAGRFYGMDRDRHWDRVRAAYDAQVSGKGHRARSAAEAIDAAYERGESDELVRPTVIGHGAMISDGDSLIAFNFRPERMREITRMFTDPTLDDIRRGTAPRTHYVCMTLYDARFGLPVAYPSEDIANVLAEVLSRHGKTQLHIAETEKYAHVTFYLNGGKEEPFPGERWCLVPSPRVRTYDLKPEMSAFKVTKKVVNAVKRHEYDFIAVNFANPDMVGHTGVLKATVRAVETVDACVGRIVDETRRAEGVCLITADHGKAEVMIEPGTHEPHTAHSSNPVPFIMVADTNARLRRGILADVAPTVLGLLNIRKPREMTGQSLLIDAP
jgi:2,3-bisphosphoglycerate-independent phosphoglycerate mutase